MRSPNSVDPTSTPGVAKGKGILSIVRGSDKLSSSLLKFHVMI